jgi:hypothetical protein
MVALVGLVGVALIAGPWSGDRPASPRPAVIWAVGDGADGSRAARRLAASIARSGPDRFLYLGDVYPHGSADDFAGNYAPVYGRLDEITAPTPGNHDWQLREEGYLRYWESVKGRRQPSWYSFKVRGWELLSLNSEDAHGPGSAQVRWLRDRLREPGTCRLAFWHRPRYNAGAVHGDAPDVAPLWNALRGRARLVLNGHEHNLQRFHARDGITQLISGAGGTPRYGLDRDRRVAFGRAGVTGALRILLAPGSADLEFRAADGSVLDRSRVTCQR